ncbi:MAG: hydrogenase maturation nickel metallochaperone HypA [Firmicutes bacterium]|nr:hydrogenase maturation nickel metallochaperone HypA [Bacillota bacterium]
MHELAITEGILKTVLPAAEQGGAKKILEIRLRIGEFSDIVPECVQAYLDIIGEGTIAEGAKVEWETVPSTVRCRSCGFEGHIDRRSPVCPACGSNDIALLTGREFSVEDLVVE